MYEFWKIPTANMTYNSFKNYTNTMVDEHNIHTFKFVVVVFVINI